MSRQASEPQAGMPARAVLTQAVGASLLLDQREVRLELLLELVVQAPAANGVPDAVKW
jgi:hypothetical protein